ncbi:hypothetical protein CGRA01v4_06706 [Colletotrichum graminicola]|nr:hypothetical protein CGRA01v4_06706 [Colletotrichum graminicola]
MEKLTEATNVPACAKGMPDSLSWTLCALSNPLRGCPLTSRTTWLRPPPLQSLNSKLVDGGMLVLYANNDHSQPPHTNISALGFSDKPTDNKYKYVAIT